MDNKEFTVLYCSICRVEKTYEVEIIAGCADNEFVNCETCNEFLGNIRCDRGLPKLVYTKPNSLVATST